mmetsp:Transcript_2851/g.11774  ORF Transcript_2851/g.11774 Transcript_2851/m.11774 type:complete len:276 (+) Transcript_2851:553-1380(+)
MRCTTTPRSCPSTALRPPNALHARSTRSSRRDSAAATGLCSINRFKPGLAAASTSACACSLTRPAPLTSSTSPGAWLPLRGTCSDPPINPPFEPSPRALSLPSSLAFILGNPSRSNAASSGSVSLFWSSPSPSARAPSPGAALAAAARSSTVLRCPCLCASNASSSSFSAPNSGNTRYELRSTAMHSPVSFAASASSSSRMYAAACGSRVPCSSTSAPSTALPQCPNRGSVSLSRSNRAHSAVGKWNAYVSPSAPSRSSTRPPCTIQLCPYVAVA